MKKIFKFITGRLFIISFIILIQLLVLFFTIFKLSSYSIYIQGSLTLLSLIFALIVINDDSNPMFKISWLIPMLTVPVIGWMVYFMFQLFPKRKFSHKTKNKYQCILMSTKNIICQDETIINEINDADDPVLRMSQYIKNTSGMNIYKNTQTMFFPTGEEFFAKYIEELKKAEKFIFIEYFIIKDGKMWSQVLDILKEKAASGVEVRVMYDDLGTISLLDKNYDKQLQSYGIKCVIFNPYRASIDAFLNYRDHRKITVIDGNTGFTGGLNLSDEYINKKKRFGYWKDCAIMLKGDAVSSMSILFMQLWNLASKSIEHTYNEYFSSKSYPSDGFVQPFGDGPMTGNQTGELAYMGLINSARKYVYITTPYLILDNEMITALCHAAKSGVDVKIMTPNIPDKWYVHSVTRSNYPVLIKAGVKIYEYLPGFIHSKTIVADDIYGVVGTSNFDFRSFYLHFENGIFMYKSKAVCQVKQDYLQTLTKCSSVTLDMCKNTRLITRIVRSILKVFSPLM